MGFLNCRGLLVALKVAGYIVRTKIPALGDILVTYFSSKSLKDVAKKVVKDVAKEVDSSTVGDSPLYTLIKNHTGFTNFYNAYRNSVLQWIEDNFNTLLPLYKRAYSPEGDDGRLKIIEAIAKLPGIPKAQHPEQLMRPENFLTPAFFILDPEIKFPLIMEE